MAKKQVNINLSGLIKLVKDLPKHKSDLEEKIAKKAPEHIIENVYRGRTGIFPSNALPFNKLSTVRRKGQAPPGIQLDDTGDLLNGNWQVTKGTDGWLVAPPQNRQDAVFHLQSKTDTRPAYKIMEIPKGFFPSWAAVIIRRAFKKLITKYQ